MKFSCNSCNTKYNLPDEKFAGKIITLTCKKCGAKIVVKPTSSYDANKVSQKQENVIRSTPMKNNSPALSFSTQKKVESDKQDVKSYSKSKPDIRSDELSPDKIDKLNALVKSSAPEKREVMPVEEKRDLDIDKVERFKEDVEEKKTEEPIIEDSDQAVWYYSRGGQQKGPYTDEEVREFVYNNVITPKTFIWKEGMMDWMRAGTAPEFRHFFESEIKEEKKEKRAIESLGLEELNKKFAREERLDSSEAEEDNKSNDNSLQDDFFSKEVQTSQENSSEIATDWSKLPAPTDGVEEQRENTRIVIMKAGLSESSKRKRMMTRIIVGIVLLSVFVFVFVKNLKPILSLVGVQIQSGIDLSMEDLDKDTLSKMTPEEREKYKKALLGIKETKKLTKEQKRSIAMAITQKKESDVMKILETAKVGSGNVIYDNLGKERMGVQSGSAISLDLDSKLAGLGINTKIEGVDLSNRVGKQDVDLSKKMPDKVDTLSEDVIMMVVGKNRGSVKYCYERHLKASSSLEGKAVFKITIVNSGSVSRVDSLSKQISGSLFEECIIKEIKKWTFPKFSGEPVVFEIPFVLTSIN